MRKVYILPQGEEALADDAVLDALAAAGITAEHEGDLENPECPLCGGATLLAYSEDDEFEVLTWCCLVEDDEGENADAWYLVCQNPECHWEEQVERVRDPMGATIFDMSYAHSELDENLGLIGGRPIDLLELAKYLKGLQEKAPNRKVQCYLDEAEWRYEDEMADVRKWLERIPSGRRIEFYIGGEEIKAKFLTATEEGMLVLKQPGDELLAVRAEALHFYGPKCFDEAEPDPTEAEEDSSFRNPDRWISLHGYAQKVVIRGFHLRLSMTDRLGQYHVTTTDPAAALALGLEQAAANWWKGRFRRADIEARYDEHRMLKVCGHWVEMYGETDGSHFPAVRTEDPAIAAELGLKPAYYWFPSDIPQEERGFSHYDGIIPQELVEAERFDRTFHWPQSEAAHRLE